MVAAPYRSASHPAYGNQRQVEVTDTRRASVSPGLTAGSVSEEVGDEGVGLGGAVFREVVPAAGQEDGSGAGDAVRHADGFGASGSWGAPFTGLRALEDGFEAGRTCGKYSSL